MGTGTGTEIEPGTGWNLELEPLLHLGIIVRCDDRLG